MKLDNMMQASALKLICDDNEPTRRALAYTRALIQHMDDLLDDDPGDHDDLVRVRSTVAHLRIVEWNLKDMIGGRHGALR